MTACDDQPNLCNGQGVCANQLGSAGQKTAVCVCNTGYAGTTCDQPSKSTKKQANLLIYHAIQTCLCLSKLNICRHIEMFKLEGEGSVWKQIWSAHLAGRIGRFSLAEGLWSDICG
jgi:hypothetical protein